MEVQFPKLTGYQQEVYDWLGDAHGTGKVAVIKSCRQTGKSFFNTLMLTQEALRRKCTSVYIAPTLDQARTIFKQISSSCRLLIDSFNNSILTLVFKNGSQILFKSSQQKEALRGFTVSGLLILDECAYLDDETIYTVLPFTNVYRAPIIITSTPFTMSGYFFQMFQLGQDGQQENVRTFDWASEKEIERFLTPERKEFYKVTMSRNKFKTEVLGEFLTDDGLLFTNISACINNEPDTTAGQQAHLGIDFGTGQEGDYTVICVINARGQLIDMQRINNLTPMAQVDWLAKIINELGNKYVIRGIIAEQNRIGPVDIDALRNKIKYQITNFVTSNGSKQDLVTSLQIALEQEKINLLENIELLNELRSYEAQITPNSKIIKYNGKSGTHDDCVMALMFAWHSYISIFGNYSYYGYATTSRKINLKEKYN